MPSEKFPSDFDWVTARHQCSALNMFQMLQAQAEHNVSTVEALARARTTATGLKFIVNDDTTFANIRPTHVGEIGVRFTLRDDRTQVTSQGVKTNFVATLTLNNDGECRLLVDGEELDRWQVLRRALEPVLFRPAN